MVQHNRNTQSPAESRIVFTWPPKLVEDIRLLAVRLRTTPAKIAQGVTEKHVAKLKAQVDAEAEAK